MTRSLWRSAAALAAVARVRRRRSRRTTPRSSPRPIAPTPTAQTDKRRDPVKLLAFTGVKTGMTVLDMGAGGGY